jgi:anti-sigma factor RsiW
MDCNQIRPLIAAHLDGELDVIRDAEVVAHLDRCPTCADAALAHAASRGLIQEKLPRYTAPADLHADIRAALRAESKPTAQLHVLPFLGKALGLAASLAIVASAGYQWGVHRERSLQFSDEIVSNHVRSLMTGHSYDVVSSDQHTVKPWFAGKLDFSPAVPDLSTDGFPLLGGRVDRLGNRPVATLVYGRRKHVIDLYVWVGTSQFAPATFARGGYNVIGWTQGAQNFVAVSDLSLPELTTFSGLQKKASSPLE